MAVIPIRDQESGAEAGKNSGLNNRSFFPLKRTQAGRGPVKRSDPMIKSLETQVSFLLSVCSLKQEGFCNEVHLTLPKCHWSSSLWVFTVGGK